MSNKYVVKVFQTFSYPIEVVADSYDDAVDVVRNYPREVTDKHQYEYTSHTEDWKATLLEKDTTLPYGHIEQKPYTTITPTPKLSLDYQEVRTAMIDFSNIINRSRGWAYCAGFYEAMLLDLVMGYADQTDIISRMTKVVKQLNQEAEQQSTG